MFRDWRVCGVYVPVVCGNLHRRAKRESVVFSQTFRKRLSGSGAPRSNFVIMLGE